MAWKSGTSGNPNGRPKRSEAEKLEIQSFKSRLKQYSVDALQVLYHMMCSEQVDSATRYKCAAYILDKTYGKAFLAVDNIEEQDRTITVNIQSVGKAYCMSEADERKIMEAENNLYQAEEPDSEWNMDESWGDMVYAPSGH